MLVRDAAREYSTTLIPILQEDVLDPLLAVWTFSTALILLFHLSVRQPSGLSSKSQLCISVVGGTANQEYWGRHELEQPELPFQGGYIRPGYDAQGKQTGEPPELPGLPRRQEPVELENQHGFRELHGWSQGVSGRY